MADVRGMTIALNAGDFTEVLDFYTLVFGHGPDTAPLDDFLEWQISPGAWLQLSTGHDRPGANNARVRLEVGDIDTAVGRLAGGSVPVGEVVVVPDVVSFVNFSDNWGNALGFYQLLSPRDVYTPEERRRHDTERAEEIARAAAEADAAQAPHSDHPDLPPPGAGVPGAHP
ncbi:hypothetical protein KEM60_01292 [Austwickia sp. TVS 96-490-7B]|uniref:VOC family protein n=1 Tax=Austwickia sp. TVS 96-490-7B TaxID=2830843 RepID=UPI001C576338|nr:VOC family protein [Austwickia sp. TVS 96-490-7B]MBW3085099.1 hypothetical protein [Austwickia sp. TVS 96-490-7B]